MARRTLAWECKYCGALKKTESIAIRHEITCLSNPEARNCILCKHSYKSMEQVDEASELRCTEKKCKCSRAVSAKCEEFDRSIFEPIEDITHE